MATAAKSQTPAVLPQTWIFTLILTGPTELSEALADALYEAGCDDALLGCKDGVLFLDFDRDAGSFKKAVLSAIAAVEKASIGAQVVRVEPDDLVTMAEIARRSGRSRESVRLLVIGQRGPGGFPPPVANLSKKSPIWRWREVERWLMEKLVEKEGEGGPDHAATASEDALVGAINAMLELRRHVPDEAEARQLYQQLLAAGRRSRKSGG